MRKTVLVCIFFLPVMLTAQQSTQKLLFYANAGYRSSAYIKEASQKHIISETETKHHRCIVLNAGLQWSLPGNWRIGPCFTYDHFGTKRRSVEFSNLSYMFRVDRIWKKTSNYSIYSGIAAGIRKVREFENETEISRRTTIGFQVYAAGIEYRLLNWFYLDANAGYGVSGILNAGGKFYF